MRYWIALLLLGLTVTSVSANPNEDPWDHALTAFDGSEMQLSEFRGKVVVVTFWASWCRPCREELPIFARWDAELPDSEVVFAAISIDQDRRKAERFIAQAEGDLPYYHDGPDGLARQLDIPYLPCTYVLDAAGNVALITPGATEEKLAELRSAIDALRPGATMLEANSSGAK